MRKFPVIVALVLIIVGWAYALVVNLLPDNSRFPRVPTGDGTIGWAIAKILGTTDLANYIGDGTVANTNMLSGVTADKLLKAQDICLAPNVWIKTDANGKPVCGSSNMLAVNIGTVQIDTCVGAAIAYRADGTTKTFSDGDIVLQGDIVQTDAGCPITIAFADLSLIRLDGGSTVSLDTGVTTWGQSIAYAILNNGGLWGRVLTENGEYRIGNDDIVAGVRGTSIQFTKEGASPTPTKNANGDWVLPPATPGGTFQVVHSTQPGVNLECTKENTTTFVGTGKIATLPTSGDCTPTLSNLSVAGGSIYTNPTAPKVAENTLADLEYMSERRAVPRINTEFDITKPKNTKDKNDICDPTGTTSEEYWENLLLAGMEPCLPQGLIAFADYTLWNTNMYFFNSVGYLRAWKLDITWKTLYDDGLLKSGISTPNADIKSTNIADTINRKWWNSDCPDDDGREFCKDLKELRNLWWSDILVNINPSSKTSHQWGFYQWKYDDWYEWNYQAKYVFQPQTFSFNGGIPITTAGQYISYPLPLFPGWASSLAGRTVMIELGSPVGNITHIPAKYYVLDLWWSLKVSLENGTWKCWWVTSPNSGVCRTTGTTIDLIPSSTSLTVNLPMSINPTQMVVGNLWSPSIPSAHLQASIWTTIKKISIQ